MIADAIVFIGLALALVGLGIMVCAGVRALSEWCARQEIILLGEAEARRILRESHSR